ncbi:helix-turn-helix transcriptional regulator [Kaistia dalseonensis]|uniref:Ribosome-binding protein aMBF1 (Putative translation factor) n=1 Tax=Kaistia dalseonensis TaxID=410840 RepID=A0ABU0H2T5_9HYPH|nr:helix-turn-helix transcriptional regulator [Kaistia dalseonensis]MCX5493636.1 helix-turn-helix transcriptional regulator [Kaistia dalseonensis]MDQ0436198.1 ribosome-binding protein aMBF1 (putative translation factor) [Kaistia dalseonensis]
MTHMLMTRPLAKRRGNSLFDHELEDMMDAKVAGGVAPLTAARAYRGLSIARLAQQSGIPASRILAIEQGLIRPGEHIGKLSQALNIPPALIDRG